MPNKNNYLSSNKPQSKERNKKHYKNSRYDMYSWVTGNGKKKYQINGKLVHSNEFKEVLLREFPGAVNNEYFTLDFKLKVVKDDISGVKYYCDDKRITKQQYIDLGNQQKNDFLKALQSKLNGFVEKKASISNKDVVKISNMVNFILNNYENTKYALYDKKITDKDLKSSKLFFNKTLENEYNLDELPFKDIDNIIEDKQMIGREPDIDNDFPKPSI